MKCLKCGLELRKGKNKCLVCGYDNKLEDASELELPILKEEVVEITDTDANLSDNDFTIELKDLPEDETFDKFVGLDEEMEGNELLLKENYEDDDTKDVSVDLGKTISISSLEENKNKEEDLSLIDDINKQIDEINEEASVEQTTLDDDTQVNNSIEEDLSSKDSFNKRKKILAITGTCCLLLAVIIVVFLIFNNSSKKMGVSSNYMDSFVKALQVYYDTRDIDDVIYVLDEIKKEPEKVKKVQERTRTICDSWVLLYLGEEANSKEKFDEISIKYKDLFNGLHSYALVKYDDNYIKALNDADYEELISQIDDIYSDSTTFFDALSYYNENDYNKAYYIFEKIEKENSYYDKAISFKSTIIGDVLSLLNKDIKKVESGIEDLNDSEKLDVYTQIESIILEYNNVYTSINLSSDEDYQQLLSLYTSKVSTYTDKVFNNPSNIDKNEETDEPIKGVVE